MTQKPHSDGDHHPDQPTHAGGYADNAYCQEIMDELYDLLDHPCDPTRRLAILEAVESCPDCFRAFGVEQEVRALLKKSCCEEAPESLRVKVTTFLHIDRTVE